MSRRVARLVIPICLIACIGVIAVRAQDDGPPVRRTFGPDSYAVGVFTGQGTTTPGLTCDAPADPSTALTCDGFLASSVDGTLLDVTVRVPQTAGPHPVVVLIHGWGASKNAGRQYDTELSNAGYTYLRYTTRGFGRSWGQANFGDVNVELPTEISGGQPYRTSFDSRSRTWTAPTLPRAEFPP